MPYYGSNTNFHFQGGMTGQSEDTGYEALEREANSYQRRQLPEARRPARSGERR